MAGNKRKIIVDDTQPIESQASENTQEVDVQEEKVENGGDKKKPKRINQTETIKTHEGYPLTEQEARFIDEYCVHGNGRQAYIAAYPNTSPKSATQNAHRLISKDYIISEINYRLEMARQESIATASEIMNYFSAVMRGEIKDQFGMEAPLSERTKAAVELAKRQIDIPQRLADNKPPEIKITLDWGGNTDSKMPTVAEVLGVDTASILKQIDGDKGDDTGDE